MDTRIIANNLKIYRNDKGYTQAGMAAAAGVSLSMIKKIEGGQCPEESRVLLAITKALGITLSDLFLPLQIPERVYFRSQKKMKEPLVLLDKISKWLQNYETIESIQNSFVEWSLNGIPYNGDPEKLAMDVRERLEIAPHEPILDICGLLDSIGVKLYFGESFSEGFFGLCLLDKNDAPVIVVNTGNQISTERKIFSAAHELGHILMHFHGFRKFDVKMPASENEDNEADKFASYFLMPSDVFIRKWNEAGGYDFYNRVMCVKQYFQVSYKTIIKRLAILNSHYTEKEMYIIICNECKKRGQSLRKNIEPSPMKKYVFIEKRFRKLVFDALIQGNITVSRAAEMLGIPIAEILNIAQGRAEVL